MFQKILVPVDLTDVHQPALDIAARLAQGSAGAVTLLHVIEVIAEVWAGEDRDFYDRLEQIAHDHLARLGHYLGARAVPRREEVVFGNRAPEIVRYAVEEGIDLIVLKSHRIDLEHPSAGWGTVSYKVSRADGSRHQPCGLSAAAWPQCCGVVCRGLERRDAL